MTGLAGALYRAACDLEVLPRLIQKGEFRWLVLICPLVSHLGLYRWYDPNDADWACTWPSFECPSSKRCWCHSGLTIIFCRCLGAAERSSVAWFLGFVIRFRFHRTTLCVLVEAFICFSVWVNFHLANATGFFSWFSAAPNPWSFASHFNVKSLLK